MNNENNYEYEVASPEELQEKLNDERKYQIRLLTCFQKSNMNFKYTLFYVKRSNVYLVEQTSDDELFTCSCQIKCSTCNTLQVINNPTISRLEHPTAFELLHTMYMNNSTLPQINDWIESSKFEGFK